MTPETPLEGTGTSDSNSTIDNSSGKLGRREVVEVSRREGRVFTQHIHGKKGLVFS